MLIEAGRRAVLEYFVQYRTRIICVPVLRLLKYHGTMVLVPVLASLIEALRQDVINVGSEDP